MVTPKGTELEYAIRFEFKVTNNKVLLMPSDLSR